MDAALKKAAMLRRQQRGMTLLEIMVVIVILGMIAGAVVVAVIPQLNKARQDTARLEISAMMQGLQQYNVKRGKYPDTAMGLKALIDDQDIDKLKADPWGHDYVYMLEGGKPVVISYGKDGQPGGEGLAMDLSSKDTGSKQ